MGADDVVRLSATSQATILRKRQEYAALQARHDLSDFEFALYLSKANIKEEQWNWLSPGVQFELERIEAAQIGESQAVKKAQITEVVGGQNDEGEGSAPSGEITALYVNWLDTADVYRARGNYGPIDMSNVVVDPDTGEMTAQPFRPFTPYSGQRMQEQKEVSSYSASVKWVFEQGGEADFWGQVRNLMLTEPQGAREDRKQSISWANQLKTVSTYMVGKNKDKPITRVRDPKTGLFATPTNRILSESQLAELESVIRGVLLDTYDEKIGKGRGGEQTGELRRAVAASTLNVIRNDVGGFSIDMPLPDRPGAPRENTGTAGVVDRPNTVSATPGAKEGYGKYVFFGRGPILHKATKFKGSRETAKGAPIFERTFMRYKMFGKYITTTSVLASDPGLNIYDLNPERLARVTDMITDMVAVDAGGKMSAA